MMKKFLIAILMLLPVVASGQGKIYTRKSRLEGYENKVTKVVVSGNVVMDALLRSEMTRRWTVGPYEFCSDAFYEEHKSDGELFFLSFVAEDMPDDDHQLISLQYVKAGPDGHDKPEAGFELLKLPVGYFENGGVPMRYLKMLPFYVDIVQNYLIEAAQSDKVSYIGLETQVENTAKGKTYCFSNEDLGSSMTAEKREEILGNNVFAIDEDQWLELFNTGKPDDIIGIIVAPTDKAVGTTQFKILLGVGDHKLYYFNSSKIRRPKDFGFQALELGFWAKNR